MTSAGDARPSLRRVGGRPLSPAPQRRRGSLGGGSTMKRAPLAMAVALAAAALPAARARATNYLVASGNDDFTTNGGCSLREALAAATTNAPRDACAAGSPDVA